MSKNESVVPENVYPQHHSVSFGISFYQLIFLLQAKVSKLNIPQNSMNGVNI